jgi:hypothetical protein
MDQPWSCARAVLLVLVMATIALACGEDTVDATKVESEIEQELSSATAEIVSVSCPDGIDQKEGKQFSCDAKLDEGGRAEVVVTVTSDRGDAVYAFKPGTVEVSGKAVEPVLEDALEARGVSGAQADCPQLIKVTDGSEATCSVAGAGGRSGEVTFTWSDAAGEIDEASVETSAS